MTVNGYDLSACQGVITAADWQTMKASGIGFVFDQAYIGNDGPSSTYTTYKAGAASVGISHIPYTFLYPFGIASTAQHPNRDAVSQAQLHWRYCQCPIAIDLEYPVSAADMATYGCSPSQIVDWTCQYQETYKSESGVYCLLYSYPYYVNMLGNPTSFANYSLWIASYEPTPAIPAPWNSYCVWQYSGGGGKLPSGSPVDQDCVSSLDVLAPWLPALAPVAITTQAPIPVVITTPTATPAPITEPTMSASAALLQSISQFFTWLFGSKAR